ncbi:MAG: GNAT family N-acetyltransferase [Armatimonadota bacterium]|nr:aminoacyltransferase [bacterium]
MTARNQLDILTTAESDNWQNTLAEIGTYDTYHMPSYHKIAEECGEGKAMLLVYRQNDYIIAFPMLIRDIKIPRTHALTGLKDTTSAYGYGGPVANREVPAEVLMKFNAALHDFYTSNNVVSAFARFHPLLMNSDILFGYGEVAEIGATISIDLTPSPDEQYANYRRAHRRTMEKLWRAGFTVRKASHEELDEFIYIYYQTMARNDADDYYYFDKFYFHRLFEEMPGVPQLFFCDDEDVAVSSCIAFQCNGIVQGHLGGTLNNYLPLAPMKLVLDCVREWGNEIGAHTFHLGGGVGCRRDSLFEFKRGFSRREHVCHVWRNIVDQDAYDDLCHEAVHATGVHPDDDFFPMYRHPAFEPSRELNAEAAAAL